MKFDKGLKVSSTLMDALARGESYDQQDEAGNRFTIQARRDITLRITADPQAGKMIYRITDEEGSVAIITTDWKP